jgi:hypothetical protein
VRDRPFDPTGAARGVAARERVRRHELRCAIHRAVVRARAQREQIDEQDLGDMRRHRDLARLVRIRPARHRAVEGERTAGHEGGHAVGLRRRLGDRHLHERLAGRVRATAQPKAMRARRSVQAHDVTVVNAQPRDRRARSCVVDRRERDRCIPRGALLTRREHHDDEDEPHGYFKTSIDASPRKSPPRCQPSPCFLNTVTRNWPERLSFTNGTDVFGSKSACSSDSACPETSLSMIF